MFGDYDAIKNQPYEYSLVCRSLKGEVFVIDAQDFIKRVSHHNDSWSMIIDKGYQKCVQNKLHIAKSDYVRNANLVEMDKLKQKMEMTKKDNLDYKRLKE